MTLCAEIQELLERTYSPAGVRLEDCVIGPGRCGELSRLAGADGLAGEARTFLRRAGDNLHIAIYFSPELVETLEREHPGDQISHRNVRALISFIEELTHGVHAALAFQAGRLRAGRESFLCDLELMARVDTFYILLRFAALLGGGRIAPATREWLHARVFDDERFSYRQAGLRRRYRTANRMAARFVRICAPMDRRERVDALRSFRPLSLAAKERWLRRREGAGGTPVRV